MKQLAVRGLSANVPTIDFPPQPTPSILVNFPPHACLNFARNQGFTSLDACNNLNFHQNCRVWVRLGVAAVQRACIPHEQRNRRENSGFTGR